MAEPLDLKYPVRDMKLVPRACDPSEPLASDDQRYADWNELRHGIGHQDLARDLERTNGGYHHGCLCGHRGCGKSTELLRLKSWADANGYLTVHTEVDSSLGLIDLKFSDLYLLAATSVEQAMKAFGKPLPVALVKNVISWFADIVKEDTEFGKSEISIEAQAQAKAKIPMLASLFAKFTTASKAGTNHVRRIRTIIQNYPESLINCELPAEVR
jgi:hypothetical protein